MMNLLDAVNTILALATIVSQVFIVLAIIYLFLPNKNKTVNNFFTKNSIALAFVVALVSTCGSLFYSNVAGFSPCPLCWFQRIFMYPEVVILGLGLLKKDERVIDYTLPLSIIGLVISLYHNYIVFNGLRSLVCTASEPCTTNFVLVYGYITIPMMALTAFALISLLLILFLISRRTNNMAPG